MVEGVEEALPGYARLSLRDLICKGGYLLVDLNRVLLPNSSHACQVHCLPGWERDSEFNPLR